MRRNSVRGTANCLASLAMLLIVLGVTPVAVARNPPDDDVHAAAANEEQAVDEEHSAESHEEHATEAVDETASQSESESANEAKKQVAGKSKGKKGAAKAKSGQAKKESGEGSKAKQPVVTRHKVTIDGDDLAYKATAGKMALRADDGKEQAEVFFVAYTKTDAKRGERPISFCFNGGPGSSSVWLHLGMLGPVRVKLDSDAKPLRPPHELIPNPYSLLDQTDLVFIDPVSTGYSRPAKEEDGKQFHGYDQDLRSVAQFIHDYTTKYNRWASPKFLIGESYGGLRAAGLSSLLQDRYHLYLNGIVLVSAVVDFQTIAFQDDNDLAYAMFLPSYTATAWRHKKLSDDLQKRPLTEVVAAAEAFARGPYLRALAMGASLAQRRREQIVERMAELTGLSKKYVDDADLRVAMWQFGKELLRDERRVVGRFDSRYTGLDDNPLGEATDYDPSASAVFGTFTSAVNDYLRSTLKVREERVYEILTDRVQPWDYGRFTNRFVDASQSLRSAMTENPYLKVFAACGYYDLATPEFGMVYTRDHLGLPEEIRDNFTLGFYEGGHMMYAHEPSLVKLREDLVKFYESALEADKNDVP